MEVLRFASLMWKFMDAETAWMAQIQNQSIATWMRISQKASGQNCMHFEVVNKTFRHCLTSDKMLPKFMCSIAVLKLGLEFSFMFYHSDIVPFLNCLHSTCLGRGGMKHLKLEKSRIPHLIWFAEMIELAKLLVRARKTVKKSWIILCERNCSGRPFSVQHLYIVMTR